MDKPEFFLMIAAIAGVAGVVIFLCRWPLRGPLGSKTPLRGCERSIAIVRKVGHPSIDDMSVVEWVSDITEHDEPMR